MEATGGNIMELTHFEMSKAVLAKCRVLESLSVVSICHKNDRTKKYTLFVQIKLDKHF